MSIRIVLKYLGIPLMMLGGFLGVPLLWSVAVSRDGAHVSFLVPMLLALLSGWALFRWLPQERRSISRREGLALVALAWLCAALVGTLPYLISGVLTTFAEAFFEAMSGFTTTGATVLTSIGQQPPSILLWRNLSQWIGGMGIITFFVALFPMLGVGAARLFAAEMPGPQGDRVRARVSDSARILWALYVGLSVLLFVLLWLPARIPVYDALNITLATMPSGGFLHLQESIGAYSHRPFVITVITAFMLVTGVNYALYYWLLQRRQMRLVLQNPEFRLYVGIYIAAAAAVAIDLVNRADLPLSEAFRYATFQVASIYTTTGFTITDYDVWPYMARSVLLGLMVIGACAGSTAGGFKVIRLLVVVRHSLRQVVTAFSPRSVIPLKVGGEVIPESQIAAITGLGGLLMLSLLGGFLFMNALGLDKVTAFSTVLSTVCNIGPGFAGIGPAHSYAFIPDAGKIVLAILMLVGRLEFVTVLALFSASFWRWR